MKHGKYLDRAVSVYVTEKGVEIESQGDFAQCFTIEAAGKLLAAWEPDMKSRGNFLRVVNGKAYRSHDVKSVVRCLRRAQNS